MGIPLSSQPSATPLPVITLLLRANQQAKYTNTQIRRQFLNGDAMVDALKRMPGIELKLVDLEDLTFKEQVLLLATTSVLVGMHGAGLTNGMFLRPGAAMIEISPGSFTGTMTSQVLFKTIAADAGAHYTKMVAPKGGCNKLVDSCDVPPALLVREVANALNVVRPKGGTGWDAGAAGTRCSDPLAVCGGAVPAKMRMEDGGGEWFRSCTGLQQKMINFNTITLPTEPNRPIKFQFPSASKGMLGGSTSAKGNFLLPWMFAFAVSRWVGVGFETDAVSTKGSWMYNVPKTIPPPEHRANDAAIRNLCSRCISPATCTQPYYSGTATEAIGKLVREALQQTNDIAAHGARFQQNLALEDVISSHTCLLEDLTCV
jgi:hypothetical protein